MITGVTEPNWKSSTRNPGRGKHTQARCPAIVYCINSSSICGTEESCQFLLAKSHDTIIPCSLPSKGSAAPLATPSTACTSSSLFRSRGVFLTTASHYPVSSHRLAIVEKNCPISGRRIVIVVQTIPVIRQLDISRERIRRRCRNDSPVRTCARTRTPIARPGSDGRDC